MCWKCYNPFPLLMVSLIVCAQGLAVVLTRIGYSLSKPLLPVSSSSCLRRETECAILHMRHIEDDCQYVHGRQLRMVSHICGFELASNKTHPIGFSRLIQYLQPLGGLIVSIWQRQVACNYWRLHVVPICRPETVAIVSSVVLNHSKH